MSTAPRRSILIDTARICGAVIDATGMVPISESTSASSRRRTWSACLALRVGDQFAHQARATASKEFAAATFLAALSALRAWPGSMPSASLRRSASRRSRAPRSGPSGYAPKASSFSLPPKRYFRRHNLLPVGCTSRYRPAASKSFTGLAPGFAFRIAVSVSAMGVSRGFVRVRWPQSTPRSLPDVKGASWTTTDKKAQIYGALQCFCRSSLGHLDLSLAERAGFEPAVGC